MFPWRPASFRLGLSFFLLGHGAAFEASGFCQTSPRGAAKDEPPLQARPGTPTLRMRKKGPWLGHRQVGCWLFPVFGGKPVLCRFCFCFIFCKNHIGGCECLLPWPLKVCVYLAALLRASQSRNKAYEHLGMAQNETGGANRRFWSIFPLTRATDFGIGFLSQPFVSVRVFGAMVIEYVANKLDTIRLASWCPRLKPIRLFFVNRRLYPS